MQDGQNCGTFQTGLGSNYTGYSNKSVDADCIKLAAKSLAASVVGPIQLHAERQIIKDAFFMGIFQAPEVTAYTSDLKGISPAPYSPALFWNFWTWHF
jgi:peptide/nickel transport system substrate-binding protein